MRRAALRLAVLALLASAPLRADDARLERVRPAAGRALRPAARASAAPESDPSSSTLYRADHGADGVYFVFGTAPPRRAVWGEQIRLQTGVEPFEIRRIELSLNMTATSRVVVELSLWDAYSSLASPVNSGLLRSEEQDFGILARNAPGEFYPLLVFSLSATLPLADPDLFLEFRFKSGPGAAPLNLAARPVVDGTPSGPSVGASDNDVYTDQNANGVFEFSPPNAGDRRVVDDTAVCGPENCATNWNVHLLGAPFPDRVDPGMALFTTLPSSFFPGNFFYQGFFDFDDLGNACVPPGYQTSDETTEPILFEGFPLEIAPPGALGETDTILRLLAGADLSVATSATIPIDVAGWSLEGTIVVTYDGGQNPITWRVHTCLSEQAQSTGTLTLRRGPCAHEGGTLDFAAPLLPKLVFTQVSPPPTPPCSGTISIDFGPFGYPPWTLAVSGAPWLPDAPGSFGLVAEYSPGDLLDSNCDGILGAEQPLPASSGLRPGIQVPRCAIDACDPRDPIERSLPVEIQAGAAPGTLRLLPSHPQKPDADADHVPDVADDCPLVADPTQADADADGVGDACDDCPLGCDPEQQDGDGDGAADACDCAPADPGNPPSGPVAELRFATVQGLSWTPAVAAASYDVVRGLLSALPVGPGGGDEVCLGNPSVPMLDDPANPVPGAGFFYVVRGANPCGAPADYGSGAAPRTTSTCPAPPLHFEGRPRF